MNQAGPRRVVPAPPAPKRLPNWVVGFAVAGVSLGTYWYTVRALSGGPQSLEVSAREEREAFTRRHHVPGAPCP